MPIDRRGVGQQADGRRLKRREPQPRQHGRRHRHWRSESGGAFDERAEGERDQQRLQPAVVRQVADGILEHLELAALHRHAVEQNGRENHPPDGKQAERRAVRHGGAELAPGHSVGARGHQGGSAQPGERCHPGRLANHAQQPQQDEYGKRRDQRRQRQAAA
jgi:hypothetical protein